jgi:hypothetical protein
MNRWKQFHHQFKGPSEHSTTAYYGILALELLRQIIMQDVKVFNGNILTEKVYCLLKFSQLASVRAQI